MTRLTGESFWILGSRRKREFVVVNLMDFDKIQTGAYL